MPTEYRNQRGKSAWQPTLASGERLWIEFNRGVILERKWRQPLTGVRMEAALYSRRAAERIERREQARLDRLKCDETFREVDRD